MEEKGQEHLGSLNCGFRYEYKKCVYQSQTASEFENAWNTLVDKYGLKENAWLKEMHETCKNWVPVYLRECSLSAFL